MSTSKDHAKFCETPLNKGELNGERVEGSFTTFAVPGTTNPDADENQNGIANYADSADDVFSRWEKSSNLLPIIWEPFIEEIEYFPGVITLDEPRTIFTSELLFDVTLDPHPFLRQ